MVKTIVFVHDAWYKASMSRTLEAVLMIARYEAMRNCLLPFINIEKEEIDWNFDYNAFSGGQQTAISWAYRLWTDEPPSKRGYRDLFDGFGGLDRELQATILNAVIHKFRI